MGGEHNIRTTPHSCEPPLTIRHTLPYRPYVAAHRRCDQGRVGSVISPRPSSPLRSLGLDNELKCVAYYHHQPAFWSRRLFSINSRTWRWRGELQCLWPDRKRTISAWTSACTSGKGYSPMSFVWERTTLLQMKATNRMNWPKGKVQKKKLKKKTNKC